MPSLRRKLLGADLPIIDPFHVNVPMVVHHSSSVQQPEQGTRSSRATRAHYREHLASLDFKLTPFDQNLVCDHAA